MIILGIDIGITGAIAAVDHASETVADMPTQPVPGNRQVKREVDPRALLHLVRELVRPGVEALAIVEDIHAGTGPGSTARASLMDSRGVVRSVLAVARIDMRIVTPQKWKKFFGLDADKGRSLEVARTLFPLQAGVLARKKDHNRAEALLLAHYGKARHG